METNATEENSKIIKIQNTEVTPIFGQNGLDWVKIQFAGDEFNTQMVLDPIGANAFRIAVSSLINDYNRTLPYCPMGHFACYYRDVFVNGIEVPIGAYMDTMIFVTNPAFMKLPAKTKNEPKGLFGNVDDDGIHMYCPIQFEFKRVWIVIDTIHSTFNAFEDKRFIVLEFDCANYEPQQEHQDIPYFVPIYELRKKLDEMFPMNRFAELNSKCYGYFINFPPIKFKPYEFDIFEHESSLSLARYNTTPILPIQGTIKEPTKKPKGKGLC